MNEKHIYQEDNERKKPKLNLISLGNLLHQANLENIQPNLSNILQQRKSFSYSDIL